MHLFYSSFSPVMQVFLTTDTYRTDRISFWSLVSPLLSLWHMPPNDQLLFLTVILPLNTFFPLEHQKLFLGISVNAICCSPLRYYSGPTHFSACKPTRESHHGLKKVWCSVKYRDLSSGDKLNQYCVTSLWQGPECNGCSFTCKGPSLQL